VIDHFYTDRYRGIEELINLGYVYKRDGRYYLGRYYLDKNP
jgi:hypothetical protein